MTLRKRRPNLILLTVFFITLSTFYVLLRPSKQIAQNAQTTGVVAARRTRPRQNSLSVDQVLGSHPTGSKSSIDDDDDEQWATGPPIHSSDGCAPYELRHQIEGVCRSLSSILLAGQNIYFVDTEKVSYMYCAIPKNGCTYHFSLLLRIKYNKWTLQGGQIHGDKTKRLLRLGYQPNAKIDAKLGDPSIPKYAVVRNPMQRTLSAYKDKVERYVPLEERSAEIFYQWLKDEFPPDSRNRSEEDWTNTNAHWRPQTQYCGFHYPQIHQHITLLRFEQPEQYVEYLYKHMPGEYLERGWADGDKSFRESTLGELKRTGNANSEFFEYFTSLEMFDYLAEQLQDDIDGLGYREEVDGMRAELEKIVKL